MSPGNKLIATAFFMVLSSVAHSEILFEDYFNTEPIGQGLVNLTHWTVVNPGGSVDVLYNGAHGNLPCRKSVGRCVDLDGSSSAAAHLVSKPIALQAGTYLLTYYLAGSQRGDTNAVDVFFNGQWLRTVTLESSAPYQKFIDTIKVTSPASASIEFKHAGGDNLGLLLDRVILAAYTPVQGTGGKVSNTGLSKVVCNNITTGQSVVIEPMNGAATWDCEQAGLVVSSGDKVEEILTGRVR